MRCVRDWIKLLWQSKVQITIITPPPLGVESTTTPRVVKVVPSLIKKTKSNYRFVEEQKIDHDGAERIVYSTEEYKNGCWSAITNSITLNKEEAIKLHLKVIERGNLDPVRTKTVLWEGLDAEETRVWASLH